MDEKQELTIEWHVDGFMQNAEYMFHLPSILDGYKLKFPGAEKLIVTNHECSLYELNHPNRKEHTTFSKDRKTITIYNEVYKAYDTNGNIKSTPAPTVVFSMLSYILDNAVEKYNQNN
jgi:hypothetical protein